MKKIAVVGFHDTGSSVVDDLLRECDNVANGTSGAEVRVLHDPDGISDLEHHLVNDPHRLSSSLAIRRFLDYCKRHARMERKLVGSEWDIMSAKYANSLIKLRYKGWLEEDVLFFPLWQKKYYWLLRALNHFLPKAIKKQRWHNFFPNEETYYSSLTEKEFLVKTKDYIDWICEKMNPEHKEYLVLDQFASSHNPCNACRYTDNLKVIIVDRDPRDLFIHDVKLYKEHILAPEALDFAKQYRLIRREIFADDPSKVLRVYYEDLIYRYEETTKLIFDFLGIDPIVHHINKKRFFNPAISINGTMLWKKYPQYEEDVKIITEELRDMLYPYPKNADSIREQIQAGKDSNELLYSFMHMDDL